MNEKEHEIESENDKLPLLLTVIVEAFWDCEDPDEIDLEVLGREICGTLGSDNPMSELDQDESQKYFDALKEIINDGRFLDVLSDCPIREIAENLALPDVSKMPTGEEIVQHLKFMAEQIADER
jgi:hypothetical protein